MAVATRPRARTQSRRQFLRNTAIAAAGATVLSGTKIGRATRPLRKAGQTVAVFGGGIAGLTVAHELAERGFKVAVYERRAWGGKARSTEVPGTGAGGRKPLPGEHGWRTFFGFYQNMPDTFRRIPFGSNPNGVFDNLVPTSHILFARDGGRRDISLLFAAPVLDSKRPDYSPQQLADTIYGVALEFDLPPDAAAHFARKMTVYMSSCDDRRVGQWENTPWSEFTQADRFGDDYRKLFVQHVSEVLQASKAAQTSTQFPAHILELIIYNLLGRGANGSLFRFLNAPTNEAFIDPWLRVLEKLGVTLRVGATLTNLSMSDGRIAGAAVTTPSGTEHVHADWYVCAMPVERTRALLSDAILAADPSLAGMNQLDVDWMNGMQYFLREEGHPDDRGVIDYLDSPWLITSVNQGVLWKKDFASTYGDGRVRDCLSAIVSNWHAPGVLYGKPATDCTPEEVITEVWEQMKRHLNDAGDQVLTDDLIVSWEIDPGMLRVGGRLVSDDPLVLPSVGQRRFRPDVTTRIPNMILTGDYLASDWEVANMETANYNGRRAANAIIEGSGCKESPAAAIPSYRPPEWEVFKQADAVRYANGEPNIFDGDLGASLEASLLNQDRVGR